MSDIIFRNISDEELAQLRKQWESIKWEDSHIAVLVPNSAFCLRTDSDGHWYFFPEELLPEWHRLTDILESPQELWSAKGDEALEEFISLFDEYRLSGGYQDLRFTGVMK